MPAHFMRYILHLADKTIKAKVIMEATQRTGMGVKQSAVVYEDEAGEVCVRTKQEFERMFQCQKE